MRIESNRSQQVPAPVRMTTPPKAPASSAAPAMNADAWLTQKPSPLAAKVAAQAASPMRPGNSVELFVNGGEAFGAMHKLLDSAKKRIDMEFFSFFDDKTGRDMIDRLSKKAKEGVQVNLLVDHLGSFLKRDLLDDMRDAGIRVRPFTNGSDYPLLNANSTTDHRKILLVDGKVGMTGGMNIGEPYQNHWHDFMVKVEGPTLGDLYKTFERNWELSDGERMRDIVPDLAPKGAHAAQVAVTSPRKDEIRRSFLAAFDNAQDKILINSPYFIDEEMVAALKRASARGVKVTAMIPSVGDNPIVDQMNKSVINELLDAKIDVRLYDTMNPDFKAHDHATDNFNHGKIATIDDQLSIIGTANMDTRSMIKNQEINLNIDSKALAKEIEERVFKHDFAAKARPAVKHEFNAAEKAVNKGLNALRRFF